MKNLSSFELNELCNFYLFHKHGLFKLIGLYSKIASLLGELEIYLVMRNIQEGRDF